MIARPSTIPHEEIYVGNLCRKFKIIDRKMNYKWVLFASTKVNRIEVPQSIDKVQWTVHSAYNSNDVNILDSPYTLERKGCKTALVSCEITFKVGTSRPNLVIDYVLNLDNNWSVMNVDNQRYSHIKHADTFNVWPSISAAPRHVSPEVTDNLNDPIPENAISGFTQSTNIVDFGLTGFIAQSRLNIPEPIKLIILEFACLVNVHPSNDKIIHISNCHGVTFRILGETKGIVLNKCSAITMHIQDVTEYCEVFNSSDIRIRCDGYCHTYRTNKCGKMDISFKDTNQCVTLYNHESYEKIQLIAEIRTAEQLLEVDNWHDDAKEFNEFGCRVLSSYAIQGLNTRIRFRDPRLKPRNGTQPPPLFRVTNFIDKYRPGADDD